MRAPLLLVATGLLFAADEPNFATWDSYLGGADSSQYSSLKQINKNNVKQLQVAWTYPTGDRNFLFNPVIVEGTMFVLAKNNSLVALDAATGKELWEHPNQGALPARGINYWQSKDGKDRRLVYVNAGFLTEIDARTGETITSFGDNGKVDIKIGLDRDLTRVGSVQSGNPGRIFENIVIIPLHPAATPGDSYSSTPADIHAYDVLSGKRLWVFHSIPEPGEFGYDTWPPEAWKTAGGVHNWNEMTVDVKYGIVFIPFGTARFDFHGPNRHGQNLFGNSLVALDARTGKRMWHFQTVHHDLWDYDLPQAPKLLTVRHDGRNVDVVAQASKHGFLFVFERQTGKPLWPIEERPVPKSDVPGEESWPTQPFPTKPPAFARQSFTEKDVNPFLPEADQQRVRELLKNSRNEGLFTPPSMQGTIELPGHNGGANWGSSGVDPTKGLMYIVSKELPTYLKMLPPGQGRGGAGRGGKGGKAPPPPVEHDFPTFNAPYDFMLQSNGLSALGPPWSQLTAMDLNTGTIKWQIPDGGVNGVPQDTPTGAHFPRGGVLVTAGNLVFVATASDRKFRAYDPDNGKVAWEYDLPAGSEGVPATYELGGRQYIVLPVGGAGMMSPRVQAKELAPALGPGQYVALALPRR